jgi:DNA-binding SARP family transcriptional activator
MATDSWSQRSDPRDETGSVHLSLLGGFALRSGSQNVPLVHGAERLLAFLALHGSWARRNYVAGTLWGDTSEEHAHANLRSALWRLRAVVQHVVDAAHDELRLAPAVDVDVQRSSAVARSFLAGHFDVVSGDLSGASLWQELLPGWYEGWVILEREHHSQLVLFALEALSEHCTSVGRIDAAVLAALAAVEREPLRESAQRALISAYIEDGNFAEAMRRLRMYEQLLWDELGIYPSAKITAVFESLSYFALKNGG